MSSTFALLYYAMKSIDLSVGYAVWSGGGSATYLYCWLYAIQRRDEFFKDFIPQFYHRQCSGAETY